MFVQITDGTREAREARRARSRTPSPRKPSRNEAESSSESPQEPSTPKKVNDDSLEMEDHCREDEAVEIPVETPSTPPVLPVECQEQIQTRSSHGVKNGRMGRFKKKLFGKEETTREISIYTIDREMAEERIDPPAPPPPSRVTTPPVKSGRDTTVAQVHSFPPPRLLFLPPDDWKDPDSPADSIIRLVMCQCVLACFFFIWLTSGVLFFFFTESSNESFTEDSFRQQEKSLVVSLATDLRLINSTDSIWTATIEKYVRLHRNLMNDYRQVSYGNRSEFWTFPGCILFSVSLLTTLGLATPLPVTFGGQLGAFIFTLLGFPLHVLILSNLARTLAVKIQIFSKEVENKFCDLRQRIINVRRYGEDIPRDKDIWPEKMFLDFYPPGWLRFMPFALFLVYYTMGLLLFGTARGLSFLQSCFFFIDFTGSPLTDLSLTNAWTRLGYAWYLEGAAILAALSSVIWRDSPIAGLSTFGINNEFMTNSLE